MQLLRTHQRDSEAISGIKRSVLRLGVEKRAEGLWGGAVNRCYGKSECSLMRKNRQEGRFFYNLRCAVDCVYYVHNTDHRSAIAAVPLEVDGTRGVNIHDQTTGESELSVF